jgi:hypothetical protein
MAYGPNDSSSSSSSASSSSASSSVGMARRIISRRITRPLSSKTYPNNKGSKPSSLNNQSKQVVQQKQTQLYAELARELEEKLSKRNAEIMALRRANKVLQQECTGNRSKISNLEIQCVARSEKVAQLSDTIAARKSNKVQERLLEKSLKIADLVEETERIKFQKKHLLEEKNRNGKLLLEMCEIVRLLNKIDIVYDKAGNDDESGYYSNSIYPKSQYSNNLSEDIPQEIPMENVRRKIRAMEEALREREDLRQENTVQKQKLESLRGGNADLNLQIASQEAKLREHEEQAREREQQQLQRSEYGTSTHTRESTDCQDSQYTYRTASYSEDSSKEVFDEQFVVGNGRSISDDPSEDTDVHDSCRDTESREFLFSSVHRSLSTVDECTNDYEHDESDTSSSFSSLESPPSQDGDEQQKKSPIKDQTPVGIRPEEHKQLQNNFEKALDVIEKLKEDLSQSQHSTFSPGSPGAPYKRDFEKASKDVARLEYELQEAVTQYTVLKGQHKALCDQHEEELETAKRIRADLEATLEGKVDSLEPATKENLEELTSRNKHLELQYNDLEAEYTLKIESLEEKLKEMKHNSKQRKDESATRLETLEEELKGHQKEMKKLREENDAIESVQNERVDTLLQAHTKHVGEEKKNLEDLRYEYDTFLEIHLKLEEEAEKAKKHYKDSLLKIRNLESEAKESKDTAEKTELEHKEAIKTTKAVYQEAIEKAKTVHQKESKKLEAAIVEWKGKFMTLKRNHISATNANNEATQKFIFEIKQMKKDHGVAMVKQGRMRQSDAAKYQKLRRDFDASLVEYGKNEQITIHKYEQSKQEYKLKMIVYQQKIKGFEKLLSMSKKDNKKTVEEMIDDIQSESRVGVDQMRAELAETSKRFEAEANQRLLRAKAESKEELDRLVETNNKLQEQATKQERELEKSRECQEHVKADYHDLATSHRSSLLKIESFIQHREDILTQETTEKTSLEEGEEFTTAKGGSVMDCIKNFEKKSEETSSQPKPKKKTEENSSPPTPVLRSTPSQSGLDSRFQRDFDVIVAKSGVDSSPGQSNSESSSVVSSVGSSVTSNAIFEAIYKRVEEHTQNMEVMHKKEATIPQAITAHEFGVKHIFDILHHFAQWREVNSCFRRLPRFQTSSEEYRNAEESIASLTESGKINETISYLLVHKKRFEGVQNSLIRQAIMTQNDEMYPSRLIGLFPSEYSAMFPFNEDEEDEEEKPICADESSVGANSTSDTMRKARREAARLQGENFSKQLYINTEEIRFKTRAKELRLVEIKYQNLRQEFQEMKSVKMPLPPSNIAFTLQNEHDDGASYQPSLAMSSVTSPVMHRVNQIDCFQKKVLNAELKVECTKREWEHHKSQVHVARKEQEEIDYNLKTVMSQLDDMQDFDDSNNQLILDDNALPPYDFDEDTSEDEGLLWESESTSRKPKDGLNAFNNCNAIEGSDNGKFSFVVTHLSPMRKSNDSEDGTSIGESRPVSTASLDPQDGKPAFFGSATKATEEETEYPTIAEEEDDDDDDDEGDDSNDSSDNSSDTNDSIEENLSKSISTSIEANPQTSMEAIQLELRQAKEAAEAAHRKQMKREENLRDVIFQYKKLQEQHNEALAEKQQSKMPGKSRNKGKGVSIANLAEELNQAKANVSAMKAELDVACDNHCEEKEHLRDVLGHFKTLQADFLRVLAEKQELEKAVYQKQGLASGVVPAVNIITGPQPRFLSSSASWISASASWISATDGGVSVVTQPAIPARPKTQRPSDDVGASPLRRNAGPPQRPKTNPGPIDAGINQEVNSCKIVELCDHDRLSPTRPIRPQDHTQAASTSKLAQTIQPTTNNTNCSLRATIKNHSKTMKAPQPQQEQKHPSQLQQPQLKQQPQAKEKKPPMTKPASKKKIGIFRGWRKPQSQQGKSRQVAAAKQ